MEGCDSPATNLQIILRTSTVLYVIWYLLIYLSRYLDQETAKWPFRSSESSCHLLPVIDVFFEIVLYCDSVPIFPRKPYALCSCISIFKIGKKVTLKLRSLLLWRLCERLNTVQTSCRCNVCILWFSAVMLFVFFVPLQHYQPIIKPITSLCCANYTASNRFRFIGSSNNKRDLQRSLKTNLSWSPTFAKFCQLIAKLSVILPPTYWLNSNLSTWSLDLSAKKKDINTNENIFASLEFRFFSSSAQVYFSNTAVSSLQYYEKA